MLAGGGGGDDHEDFGGDLVPEAIVVKNILEGLYHNLDVLVRLRRFVTDEEDMRMLAEADVEEEVREKLREFGDKLLAFSKSDEYLDMKKANESEVEELGSDDVFDEHDSKAEKVKEGKKTEKKYR